MRRVSVCVVLVVGAAAGVQAQSFPSRITADTRVALESLADSARSRGLPVEPLTAKASEGVLKGADDARIVRAVRSLFHELAEARLALGDTSAAVLTAGASALHAGASRESLRRLAVANAASPSANLAVALITLADLATTRVPVAQAGEAVEQLLRRRAPAAEMAAFRQAVRDDILAGTSPDAALNSRTRAILQSLEDKPIGVARPN
jgi:hypothetical protein